MPLGQQFLDLRRRHAEIVQSVLAEKTRQLRRVGAQVFLGVEQGRGLDRNARMPKDEVGTHVLVRGWESRFEQNNAVGGRQSALIRNQPSRKLLAPSIQAEANP